MKLIDMLPSFFKESMETAGLINSMQPTADKLKQIFDEFTNEMYAHSAKESLHLWEGMCGLPILPGKSIEARRSSVMARLRGGGTCTIENLKELALSFECGEIAIEEDTTNYSITIFFTDKIGIPKYINELKNAIETAKPAHIAVEYKYTYRRWGEYEHKKWADLEPYTWNEIKEKEII